MDMSKWIHVQQAALAFAAVSLGFSSNAEPGEGAEVQAAAAASGHFVVERDADVAIAQDGPHAGGGPTTGHSFFQHDQELEFVFRKRVLHPGSAIGLHVQRENEIYYVLSGSGRYTMDEEVIEVGPGMALLTRPGGSHALEQTGSQDLVLIIVYPRH
jgi:mannose-6-phosphate isomerase-like protein (cupin superfamily)